MEAQLQQSDNTTLNLFGGMTAIITGTVSYLIDHWGLTLDITMLNMTLEEVNLISAIVLKWISIISILGLAILNWRKVLKKIGLLKSE